MKITSSFLDELAQQVLRHPRPEACLVILPSQRAAAKFERALADRMPSAGWIPSVQTLGAAIQSHTSWIPMAGAESLALLYKTWRDLPEADQSGKQKENKSFQAFMPWGQIALRDFNEIDQHLKDAPSVFKNLCDIEGIENWSFDDPESLTEGQTNFLRQYLQLGELHTAFLHQLELRQQGYSGLLARKAAESSKKHAYAHVFVAGMSALTPAETKFLKRYDKSQQLTWIWDADRSYVDQAEVEAGLFIRAHFENNSTSPNTLPNRLATTPPSIIEVNCNSTILQCQYIREEVSKLSKEERARTAIILPDGRQLPLLLQSLPEGLQDHYNVTMGLSWSDTPARSFLRTLQQILRRDQGSLHHEDIRNLLSEPLLMQAHPELEFRSDAADVLNKMAKNKWAWVSRNQLNELSSGPVRAFFTELDTLSTKDARNWLEALSAWTQELGSLLESSDSSDPWTEVGWEKVIQAVGVAVQFERHHAVLQDREDAWSFLFNGLQSERIDLLGEPEEGLQIMGLIESRALDYDRVYIMDCNEGTLPKSAPRDSFIPFDLRHELELPGRHEREAIFAYYTYRLLNRSQEVHFLYRGKDEASEKSRYLLQFERSFRPNGEDLLPLERKEVYAPVPGKRPTIQSLHWSTWSQQKLIRWSQKGISPSAWNTFMACKRDFYYKYLLQLQEPREIEDEMTASTFGTVVHKVLENGLKKLTTNPLHRSDLVRLKNDVSALLETSVASAFNLSLTESGENFLHFAMAEATVNKLIDVEIQELDGTLHRHVQSLEKSLAHTFETDHPTFSLVRLKGEADRIDLENGTCVVTDYKTGNVSSNELTLKGDWTEVLAKGKAGKALQLLIYAAIALETLGPNDSSIPEVQLGIRSGKNAKVGLLSLTIDGRREITREDSRKLLNWLISQLETHGGDTPNVDHNEEAIYCNYCTVLDPPITYFK